MSNIESSNNKENDQKIAQPASTKGADDTISTMDASAPASTLATEAAGTTSFIQKVEERDEETRKAIEEQRQKILNRRREIAEQQAKWDALPQEEKDRIEAERAEARRRREDEMWQKFLDEMASKNIDEKTVEAIKTIGDRIWREPAPKYRHSESYGREGDNTHLIPRMLIPTRFLMVPENGERHDEGTALEVAANLEGIAIGRHEDPICLWLYNTDSPCVTDSDEGGIRLYLLFSPDEIARAEESEDAEFLEAFNYLCETYGIIYDEREGDGYDYEDETSTRQVTGCDGITRTITDHFWQLRDEDTDISDLVPEECVFLRASDEVSFIIDRYRAFYHEPIQERGHIREDGIIEYDKEEIVNGFTREQTEKLKAPNSAYWRLYQEAMFERFIAKCCLDDDDCDYLDKMMTRADGRYRWAWRLARKVDDETMGEQLNRICQMMMDAVIAWDYTSGNPDGMYALLDTSPSDEELYEFMRAWMEESGCCELVRRAWNEKRDIWEVMKERTRGENIMWIAISPEEQEALMEIPVVVGETAMR